MAMAAVAGARNRPLHRAFLRALTAARETRGSNLAKRHVGSSGARVTALVHGNNSSVTSASHGLQCWDLVPKSSGFYRGFASDGEPPHEKITMPALSPTMTQGNVVKWKKNEGDKVIAGDVLCEIETDKATLDLEAMEDGFLAKIIAPAGTKDIPVGQPVCIVVEEEGDVGKFENFSAGAPTKAPSAAPPAESESSKVSSTSEEKRPTPETSSPAPDVPHENIAMPALSPTMTQGNVLKWKKKEGEKVSAGDVLCEIETDKATLDMEAMEDGYLAKILAQAGSKDIPVGQPLCIVVEDEGDVDKFKDYTGGAPAKAESKTTDAGAKDKSSESSSLVLGVGPKKNRVGPSVRRYLAETGFDASSIQGTGPQGMLLKGDLLMAMKSGPPKVKKTSASSEAKDLKEVSKPKSVSAPSSKEMSPSTDVPYHDVPNSQIRKIIAKRLLESKTGTPHLYLSADAILDPTLQLRKDLKEKYGTSVSVNDFVIRAAALALREVPEANAFWDEKSGDIVLNKAIDISVAVATDKGLMTPILKDADQKSLSAISAEVKSLAERARAGKLKPSEFQGGTFSISNLGMYSVGRFSAIINPPQACILAVGRGETSVQWAKDGDFAVTVTTLGLTLSADHRVFDGDIGGRFLKALSTNLTDPKHMLL